MDEQQQTQMNKRMQKKENNKNVKTAILDNGERLAWGWRGTPRGPGLPEIDDVTRFFLQAIEPWDLTRRGHKAQRILSTMK